ncbi:GAP family protein [Mycobacterium sp. 94-17]|uniref:GAP family protein n=1 Tax=Mycobacterium sp. 94-17 TaxID=2986147 RepID=UPI002D1F4970|nr:GAP family protein [Mycobacterium sp. 94-17]MEB4212258.1 GAP family protein [Mycobacterium sp. 94-17]
MWGSVLAMGLITGLEPMRIGVTLLVISRPRPVQNLLAYGVGNLLACCFTVVMPLSVVQVTPSFKSFADSLATSSTLRHIQVGMGVLALSIAAVMTVRWLTTRARQPAHVTAGGSSATQPADSDTPHAISRLLVRAQDASTEPTSATHRLLGRAYKAWESGSWWVALLIGLALGPPLDGVLFLLAIIVSSGGTFGTQVSAAIIFVVGLLSVVEITLASYLATPARTLAVLERVHGWARDHRRKILLTICTLGGIALVANGMGAVQMG